MITRIICTCLVLLFVSTSAHAQGTESSSWGVVGSFVPNWKIPQKLEPIATLHFTEDDADIRDLDLSGKEFRIGIVRGRTQSGDWGVSFVRKTFVDRQIEGYRSPGCQGGGSGVVILQCEETWTNLDRRGVLLNGVEVHKFIPFATISRLVQIGLNIAGGMASAQGQIDSTSFRSSYRCTFPPGVFPDFGSQGDPDAAPICSGATISNQSTVQTGATSDDVSRMLKSESSKWLPLGKVEIAAGVIVGPRVKVRVAGGLNYPGTNAVSVTGIFFLGD